MQTQPMPGMMPSQSGPKPGLTAFVPSLVGLEIPQMLQLFGDPNSPIPKNRVLAAIVEKQKEMAARKSVQNQMAMQQNAGQQGTIADAVVAQAAPVMAAHGGEMHGYAGGGAVAFQTGTSPRGLPFPASPSRIDMGGDVPIYTPGPDKEPGETEAEYLARKQKEAAEADEVSNRPLRRLYRYLAEKIREPSPVAQMRAPAAQAAALAAAAQPMDTGDELSRMLGRAPAPIPPATPPAAAPRPPGATRPGAGTGQPQNRPQAAPSPLQQLGSAVEQTGTPAPDRLAEIEADERARVEGLRGILEAQGKVDPRIVAARKEAAELAQRGIGEREKRAAGALEAAGMPLSQNLFDNQEALFRMLGAMKGGKRIGDAFSNIGQEAGAIRGEQRRALELAQRENRAEQNALDQLRQAQADLKLAQTTGDVQGERNAALKVEEAKANLGLTRLNIQKERATEADRKTQRAIEEKRIATTVSEGALDRASRERLAKAVQTGDSRRVFDTLMDNARAEFDAWAKSPEGASSVLKPGVREAKRVEFLEKQVSLAKAAGVQGLDPLLAAVKAQSGAGAARGTRENPIKLD
jgi:hypothetical protein